MVAKQHGHVKSAHKNVKLKAHHAKPYRKRHVGLLVVSIAALVILAALLIQYRDQIIGGFASSRGFVSDLFVQNKSTETTITSSHGFNLTYDQKQFYASAISDEAGKLYLGNELTTEHPYTIVRIAPSYSAGGTTSNGSSALTMTFHTGKTQTTEPADTVALQDANIDPATVSRAATSLTSIGGQVFKKTTWQSKSDAVFGTALSVKFVTYSALVRNQVVTIVVNLGIEEASEAAYTPILNSISFDNTVSAVAVPTSDDLARVQSSRTILDTLTNTANASAASTTSNLTGSEKVAALYSPAVVRVYNFYCMDILIDGQSFMPNVCSGGTGSGFFVSQDGYLATNGHVAVNSPADVAIQAAIDAITTDGNTKPLIALGNLTNLKNSDFPANATAQQVVGIIVDAYYKDVASHVTSTNSMQNLAIQITPKNPDETAWLQATVDRKEYKDPAFLTAKFVAQDYKVGGEYNGFKASDVAIIKVEGSNFPITKLGTISDISQGAGISILGFPGQATDNGVIDNASSEVTLTTGKVSSIKSASGDDNKQLIETDTTIGHGNSGGPVLDDDGDVVGIATYSVDGSGTGNGTYNYIRDIKDFIDLASSKHITFDTNSETQTEWQKGLSYFYTAHYSKALVSFNKVKTLYPNDSRVSEFITASEKRIANGENVVDFPLIPVIVAAAVILLAAGVSLILIVRHHKKHMIYAAGVAQGAVQPAGPDAPRKQTVAVSADGTTITSTTPSAAVEVTQAPNAEAPGTSVTISVNQPEAVAPQPTVVVETPAPVTEATPAPVSETPEAPKADAEPVNPWFTPESTPPDQNNSNEPPKQ